MNRIAKAFEGGKAFIPFITGGDPTIDTTEKLLRALDKSGADIIQIGVPFSDPIAEGAVVEAATERALKNGCTVDVLFDMLQRVRADINAAIVFMTYYNPIYAYGVEKFIARAKSCGLDGLVVPDLPFEERGELLSPCQNSNLELISLIAPTSESRIDHIAKNSTGFLYCLSSLGESDACDTAAKHMIKCAKAANDIPCCIAVDFSDATHAKELSKFADGIIIGDAIVALVAQHGENSADTVYSFAKRIKTAIS